MLPNPWTLPAITILLSVGIYIWGGKLVLDVLMDRRPLRDMAIEVALLVAVVVFVLSLCKLMRVF